jgi:hypothetical protein
VTILRIAGGSRSSHIDGGHVLIGKAHFGRAEVFLHAIQAARAEDRHDAGPSCEEPGERDLCGHGALGRGEQFDRLDHSLVGLHRVGSEARGTTRFIEHFLTTSLAGISRCGAWSGFTARKRSGPTMI